MIVDPVNENHAINNDGQLVHAVRAAPVGTPLHKLLTAPIIGYGTIPTDFDDGTPRAGSDL